MVSGAAPVISGLIKINPLVMQLVGQPLELIEIAYTLIESVLIRTQKTLTRDLCENVVLRFCVSHKITLRKV